MANLGLTHASFKTWPHFCLESTSVKPEDASRPRPLKSTQGLRQSTWTAVATPEKRKEPNFTISQKMVECSVDF